MKHLLTLNPHFKLRILITGGSGFVGNELINALLKSKHALCALTRSPIQLKISSDVVDDVNNFASILLTNNNWKVEVRDFNPNLVIHLAAYLTSNDDQQSIEKLLEANINFGTHLLDALKGTNCKLFITTGTFAEYLSNTTQLDPAYLYAATKSAFRSILQYYSSIIGFSVLNVIPYTIYGTMSRQKKILDRIYDALDAPVPQNMSPGEQNLDFIHIEDVISFYLQVIEHSVVFENQKYTEIHLGTGVGTTPKQVASYFEQFTQKKANILWGGIPYRDRDTLFSVANRNLANNFIAWQPTITIEEGIKRYIQST